MAEGTLTPVDKDIAKEAKRIEALAVDALKGDTEAGNKLAAQAHTILNSPNEEYRRALNGQLAADRASTTQTMPIVEFIDGAPQHQKNEVRQGSAPSEAASPAEDRQGHLRVANTHVPGATDTQDYLADGRVKVSENDALSGAVTRNEVGDSKNAVNMPDFLKQKASLDYYIAWSDALSPPVSPERYGSAGFDLSKAKITSVDGKYVDRALTTSEKLPPGHDYKVRFANGRAFDVHVPNGLDTTKPAPVMFLIPGVTNDLPGQSPEGYIPEAHLNDVDDKSAKKAITVTALTDNYSLNGVSSPAWAWNMPGALISDRLVAERAREVGYDDRQYFSAVFSALPQITNADPTHSQWGYLAGSQGAAAVNRLIGDPRFSGYMPNVYLVGGSVEAGTADYPVEPYKIAPGNAQHVTIVDTRNDTSILPHPENAHPKPFVQSLLGLSAVDNVHQDPAQEQALYLRGLGQYTSQTFRAPDDHKQLKSAPDFTLALSPEQAAVELTKPDVDLRTIYRAAEGRQVDVYTLPTATHLIPGPRAGTTSWLGSNKYEGFYTAQVALDDLLQR